MALTVTPTDEMKTLTVGEKIYEIVDDQAREDVSEVKADFLQSLIYDTASGSVATFPDGAHDLPCKSVVAQIVPVQSGSGDPSPDNVRPISGWDAVHVTRAGKNLFDNSRTPTLIDCYDANGVAQIRKGYYESLPSGTYTISATLLQDSAYIYINVINKDGTYASFKYLCAGTRITNVTITLSEGQYLAVYDSQSDADATPDKFGYLQIQIELGSSATPYEPYTGSAYSVNIPQTVYGGQVDVVSGEGKIAYASAVFDGTESWDNRTGYAGVFSHTVAGMPNNPSNTVMPDVISDYLPTVKQTDIVTTATQGVAIFTWGNQIVAKISGITALSGFLAYLAEHPLTVVYPLATPTDFTVTPQEVPTLYGSNTVYADSGDVSVEYPADTKLYINKVITDAVSALS